MKYEMIFGDEKLFDGAPDECFCVAKNVYGDSVFYKEIDQCLFWHDGGTWKPRQFMSCTPIAMRSIIKEPKRWTWEDKKAGRLPEVGSRIFVPLMQEEQNVIYTSKNVIISISDSDGAVTRTEVKSIDRINPIETPSEKAKREEDEFVESTCRQNEPHSTLYSDGVRAAYRKLKGGE